jgi:NiFe hydrogenase small subunit HydA
MLTKRGEGLSRREFVQIAGGTLAALGMSGALTPKLARALEKAAAGRPKVVWLHFASDTGCTESLIKSDYPSAADLVLDILSIDYHESIMAAAGKQADELLAKAVAAKDYICVVEGGIPTVPGHGMISGREMMDIAKEVCGNAKAVVAVGSCAVDGGVPAAAPNPSRIKGVDEFLNMKGKVINLPCCPVNPEWLIGTVVYVLTMGKVPELDSLGRPKMFYGRKIHDNCPRRTHFDGGRFVEQFGSKEEALGYCLYKVGCKGPEAWSECPKSRWNAKQSWCIEIGSPCVGCSENGWTDHFSPFYSKLADVKLPYGDVTADKIGIGLAAVTGAAIVGHAVLKATKGKGDGENK